MAKGKSWTKKRRKKAGEENVETNEGTSLFLIELEIACCVSDREMRVIWVAIVGTCALFKTGRALRLA